MASCSEQLMGARIKSVSSYPSQGKRAPRYAPADRRGNNSARTPHILAALRLGAPKSLSEGTAASTAASAQGWDRLGR